jgi:hypothetical protein
MNLKTVKFTVYFSKLKNIKISKNIYKKLDQILRLVTGEDFFIKSDHLNW